jgi:hypothetical protein
MTQLVEVKRYNQWNILVEIYTDTVTIPELPEYPDLKMQLKAEQWTLSLPSDQTLDERTLPRLFQTKSLTRRR